VGAAGRIYAVDCRKGSVGILGDYVPDVVPAGVVRVEEYQVGSRLGQIPVLPAKTGVIPRQRLDLNREIALCVGDTRLEQPGIPECGRARSYHGYTRPLRLRDQEERTNGQDQAYGYDCDQPPQPPAGSALGPLRLGRPLRLDSPSVFLRLGRDLEVPALVGGEPHIGCGRPLRVSVEPGTREQKVGVSARLDPFAHCGVQSGMSSYIVAALVYPLPEAGPLRQQRLVGNFNRG
jgi:hypothetical protein